MAKQIKEGKRWAGVKNVLKKGNLAVAASTVAGGAALGSMTGAIPAAVGAASAAVGAGLAGSHKDIANDYREGKREYEYNKKTKRQHPDSFYERSGIGAKVRKQAGIKEETEGDEKLKEDIENIIVGAVDGNASLVKNSVEQVLADKVADKIEAIRFEKAQSMFAEPEEDGREKVVTDDEQEDDVDLDVTDEDELDLPEFDDEDEIETEDDFEYVEDEDSDK